MHASDYIAVTAIAVTTFFTVFGGAWSIIHMFSRRLAEIETKLNNGLLTRVDHIDTLVQEIRQHFMWDGVERRREHDE